MGVGVWVYPWSIRDEGVSAFADRVQRLGVTSVNASVLYHSARALFPRGRQTKVELLAGPGGHFPFERLDDQLGGIQSEFAKTAGREFWWDLAEQLRDRNVDLNAWAIPYHSSDFGGRLPEAVIRNCFGDAYTFALCPSQPATRDVIATLVDELAQSGIFGAVQLESTGYLGYRHFHHHEMESVGTGPLEELLLSLCFCDACTADAEAAGIQMPQLRQHCQDELERRWREDVASSTVSEAREAIASVPDLAALIEYRQSAVSSALEPPRRSCTDAGAELHAFSAIFPKTLEQSTWIEGTDFSAWSQLLDRIMIFGYESGGPASSAVGGEAMLSELDFVKQDFSPDAINTVLNLAPTYFPSLADAQARLRLLADAGISDISITNYGMLGDTRLGWIPSLKAELG